LGNAQITDLNPGIRESGLFWTAVVPAESVSVDLASGAATLEVRDIQLKDYGDIGNALVGGGPQPVPASVSLKVVWNCTESVEFNNAAQTFRGSFKTGSARMVWSARIRDRDYQSGVIGTSSSDFAELGHEENGSFY
jgi:hypothetical protein